MLDLPCDEPGAKGVGPALRRDPAQMAAPEQLTIRPRSTPPQTWTVEDEHGRVLASISQATDYGLFIHVPRGTALHGVGFGPYAHLAEVAARIGDHMALPCVLSAD